MLTLEIPIPVLIKNFKKVIEFQLFAFCYNSLLFFLISSLLGLTELLDEGAVQLLRDRGDDGNGQPILAAVGQLQFEVVEYRLRAEYNVESIMEPLGYTMARWVGGGWPAIQKAEVDGKLFGVNVVQDRWNRPVLLFRNIWKVQQLTTEEEYLKLEPWAMPPAVVENNRR